MTEQGLVVASERHDPDSCERGCTFLGHRECIQIPDAVLEAVVLTPRKALKLFFRLVRREDLIVPLGRFTFPSWSGCATWYAFQCPDCHRVSADYLHGHRLYITCQHNECGASWQLRSRRFYETEGMPAPPTPAEHKRMLRELRRQYRGLPGPPRQLPPPTE